MRSMIIEVITLVLSIVATIAAVTCTWLAIDAKIEVAAMKRSTHSVQLVPVDQLTGLKTDTDDAQDKIHEGQPVNSLLGIEDDSF